MREVDTGPVAAGFWRLLLALPVFWLLAQRAGRFGGQGASFPKLLIALAGVFFAADVAAWHVSLGYTRMSNSVLFANSGSVILMGWGIVAGLTIYGRWPALRDILAIAAAVGGIAILLGRSLEISADTVFGDGLSLVSGAMYAGYLLIVRSQSGKVGPWDLLFWTGLTGVPVLLGFALWLGEPIWPGNWSMIFGLVLVNQLIGQGLLIYALPHFSPLVIGVALLTQPAVAAIVGYVAFGEVLTPLDILGMAMVGSALVIARGQQRT